MYARMKKTYLQPMMAVLSIGTASMVAVSGNFIEGETKNEGVYDTPIDGNNAWSRGYKNVWDETSEEVGEY